MTYLYNILISCNYEVIKRVSFTRWLCSLFNFIGCHVVWVATHDCKGVTGLLTSQGCQRKHWHRLLPWSILSI